MWGQNKKFLFLYQNFNKTLTRVLLSVGGLRCRRSRVIVHLLPWPFWKHLKTTTTKLPCWSLKLVLFFDTNPVRPILNRFSKEVGFMDNLLPATFLYDSIACLSTLFVTIIPATVNYWLLLSSSSYFCSIYLFCALLLKVFWKVEEDRSHQAQSFVYTYHRNNTFLKECTLRKHEQNVSENGSHKGIASKDGNCAYR